MNLGVAPLGFSLRVLGAISIVGAVTLVFSAFGVLIDYTDYWSVDYCGQQLAYPLCGPLLDQIVVLSLVFVGSIVAVVMSLAYQRKMNTFRRSPSS